MRHNLRCSLQVVDIYCNRWMHCSVFFQLEMRDILWPLVFATYPLLCAFLTTFSFFSSFRSQVSLSWYTGHYLCWPEDQCVAAGWLLIREAAETGVILLSWCRWHCSTTALPHKVSSWLHASSQHYHYLWSNYPVLQGQHCASVLWSGTAILLFAV